MDRRGTGRKRAGRGARRRTGARVAAAWSCAAAILAAGCGGGERGADPAALSSDDPAVLRKEVVRLEREVAARPSSAAARCNLGAVYAKQGQLDLAAVALRKAAELDPRDPLPLEFLASVFLRAKHWDQARDVLTRARKVAPRSARIPTALALVEYRQGRIPKAFELLGAALELDPNYPPALYNLAVLHRERPAENAREKQKSLERAAEYFRRYLAVADDPRHVESAQRYMESLPRTGPADKRPGDEPAGRDAGRDAERQRNAEAARKLAEEGLTQHGRGDLAAAIVLYRQALEQDDQCVTALYNLGLAHKSRHETDPAKTAFQRALAVSPDAPQVHYMLGIIAKEEGDVPASVQHLTNALKAEPDYVKAHYVLGLVYMDQRRTDLARKHFEACVRLAPDDPLARRAREWMEGASGDR